MEDHGDLVDRYVLQFPSLDRMEISAAIMRAGHDPEAILEELRAAHARKLERLKAAVALRKRNAEE